MPSIKDLVANIAKSGGMAFTTGFYVKFSFDSPDGVASSLNSLNWDTDFNYVEHFLDEVNLPGAQAATGQLTGRFMGEGMTNYAHQKMFTDLQFGWLCDANMSPYKFINTWYQYIFQEYNENGEEIDTVSNTRNATFEQMMAVQPESYNRTTRLRFPADYHCTVRIAKVEKGPRGDIDRVSSVHVLQEVFPYSVEAIPLSFGSTQLVKCTANFYYGKHRVVYNDISKPTPATANPAKPDLAQNIVNPDGTLNLGSSTIA